MGYIFLTVALLSGATKGYLGKRISNRIESVGQSVFTNLVRMALCILISVGVLLFDADGGIITDINALWTGTLTGVSLAGFTVTWLLAIKHGAFMLISVAQTFGMIVTLFCSFIVFRDPVSKLQLLGVVLLIAAVLVMVSYSTKLKGALKPSAIVLLFLCGIFCGLQDFSQKLFTSYSEAPVSILNLLTYTSAFVVLGVFFMLNHSRGSSFNVKKLFKNTFVSILFMAICLFINSYFMALSTKELPPIQLYPMARAGGMMLATIMSSVFFKEKITVKCVLGLVMSFVAVMLLK